MTELLISQGINMSEMSNNTTLLQGSHVFLISFPATWERSSRRRLIGAVRQLLRGFSLALLHTTGLRVVGSSVSCKASGVEILTITEKFRGRTQLLLIRRI